MRGIEGAFYQAQNNLYVYAQTERLTQSLQI